MILAENDLTLSEAASRWGVSSANTIKARAAALGVQLRRESSTRTVWPAADIPLGDRLAEHLARPGTTLRNFPEATPSGCLFAEWIARRGCAKSTAYRMRQELGITPEKRRRPGGAIEVWLSAADEALLTAYADALGKGMSTAAALAEVGRSGDVVDGVRLAELVEQLPLSRGSVFELVKVLGIVTVKGLGPGGRGRVAWVSTGDADRLAEAAGRVHRGEVRIADLAQQERQDAPITYSHPPSERNQRWPVSLYGCNEHLYCICDDGTLWQLDGEWIQLPEVPQP